VELDINQILQQALSQHNQQKFEEAANLYLTILQIEPTHLDATHNLGVALQALGRLAEAELIYNKAIVLKPNFAIAHHNLSGLLYKLGRLDEAKKSTNNAIKFKPDFVEAHNTLGIILNGLSKVEEAEEIFKKAIALKPNYAQTYHNLGVMLYKIGRLEEAESNYNEAIKFKPDYAEAHYNLSQLKTLNKEDDHFITMKNLYSNHSLSDEQRCHLNFALAKASEELNQFDKSFEYYSNGNTIRKEMLNYNIQQDIEYFELLKKSHPSIEKNSLKDISLLNKMKPIFIVGMPRSGTTLIEQIISSHSEVMGAGELNYVDQFGDAVATGKSKVDTKALMNFRENYLKKLKVLSKEKIMVTDKMPGNFRYIGLIRSAFPDAKIIHVKRNPAATCWGNYKCLFIKKIEGYNNSLDDLVEYYRLYQDLMKFWKKIYGNQIYDLNYETLTTNQEEETRKLIQYLNLEWEDECLAPQNNKRIVYTASNKQVRQKVYQGSSEKWKKFRPFLDGAFNHFED